MLTYVITDVQDEEAHIVLNMTQDIIKSYYLNVYEDEFPERLDDRQVQNLSMIPLIYS